MFLRGAQPKFDISQIHGFGLVQSSIYAMQSRALKRANIFTTITEVRNVLNLTPGPHEHKG
jgi:hypothetical protein